MKISSGDVEISWSHSYVVQMDFVDIMHPISHSARRQMTESRVLLIKRTVSNGWENHNYIIDNFDEAKVTLVANLRSYLQGNLQWKTAGKQRNSMGVTFHPPVP